MIKLSELQRLDKVSLAEIKNIIETYEDSRMWITKLIEAQGYDAHKKIETYQKVASEVKKLVGKNSTLKKFLAILEQMKIENCGGEKDERNFE